MFTISESDKKMTLKIKNTGGNKNYMSSLAAEGVRCAVLASAVYRSTVYRPEPGPAYSPER